jgi:hypothetical protein
LGLAGPPRPSQSSPSPSTSHSSLPLLTRTSPPAQAIPPPPPAGRFQPPPVPPPDSPRGSPKRPSSDSAAALYAPLRFGSQAPTRPLRSPPVAGLPRYCCLMARLRPPCARCCPGVLALAWLGAISAVALLVPPLPPSHRRRPQARASGTIASPPRRLSEVLWLLVKPLFPLFSTSSGLVSLVGRFDTTTC